tara:strand:+ start:222 stop:413 length:192 start_codon:yes stop_codon:yes gene_type:complete
MVKFNRKNLLNFEHLNNAPLLTSNSKGENHKLRIKKIKQRVLLKKYVDINGMEINHEIIKKKN